MVQILMPLQEQRKLRFSTLGSEMAHTRTMIAGGSDSILCKQLLS